MPEKPLIPVSPAADAKIKPAEPPSGAAADSTSKVKRLDGITSIDDKVFLECEILSHSALSNIARQIAGEAIAAVRPEQPQPDARAAEPKPAPVATIILLDETLASAFQLFSALKLQLALFEKGFDGVAAPVAAPQKGLRLPVARGLAISAVTGAVEGVVDLLGLFRQDTQFSGRAVSLKETALYLEVAHSMRQEGFHVIYPRLLSFQAEEETQLSQTELSQLFDGVFAARQKAAQRLRPMLVEVAGFEQEILDREREFPTATEERKKVLTQEIQDRKARLVTARKNLDPDLVQFENTDTRWSDLQKGLAVADEKSGQVPMQLLNRAAEAIARFRTSPPAYFLYAEAIVAGGTMKIKRNLWRTLFHGDAIEFSGGAVISYALFDGKAQILSSRTHRYMTEFRRFPDNTPAWTSFNSF